MNADIFKQAKVRLGLPTGDTIVLVDMLAKDAPRDEVNRNVYRVSRSGSVLWQIESGALEGNREPFTNVYLDHAGNLKAYCWNGVEYPLDADTGQLGQGTLVK